MPPQLRDDAMTPPAGTEQVANASRVAAIDGLRGLLALVVLAWHVSGPLGVAWLLIPADIAVAVFFVLSGYVLTRGWDARFGVFLARRFVRLWPVYALCLGVGYLIAGIHPVWSEFLWYPIIGANAKPSIDPPIWSLFLEAWTMPFMPFIVWAGSGAITRAALCIAALIVAGLADPQISVGGLFVVARLSGALPLSEPLFRIRPFHNGSGGYPTACISRTGRCWNWRRAPSDLGAPSRRCRRFSSSGGWSGGASSDRAFGRRGASAASPPAPPCAFRRASPQPGRRHCGLRDAESPGFRFDSAKRQANALIFGPRAGMSPPMSDDLSRFRGARSGSIRRTGFFLFRSLL